MCLSAVTQVSAFESFTGLSKRNSLRDITVFLATALVLLTSGGSGTSFAPNLSSHACQFQTLVSLYLPLSLLQDLEPPENTRRACRVVTLLQWQFNRQGASMRCRLSSASLPSSPSLVGLRTRHRVQVLANGNQRLGDIRPRLGRCCEFRALHPRLRAESLHGRSLVYEASRSL